MIIPGMVHQGGKERGGWGFDQRRQGACQDIIIKDSIKRLDRVFFTKHSSLGRVRTERKWGNQLGFKQVVQPCTVSGPSWPAGMSKQDLAVAAATRTRICIVWAKVAPKVQVKPSTDHIAQADKHGRERDASITGSATRAWQRQEDE